MEQFFAFSFMEYIVDKALILIPVLLILGKMLKSTPRCPDWCIPWILLVCGIALSVLMLGVHVDAVIQGALAAGAAVYGNQLWKQTQNKDTE